MADPDSMSHIGAAWYVREVLAEGPNGNAFCLPEPGELPGAAAACPAPGPARRDEYRGLPESCYVCELRCQSDPGEHVRLPKRHP